MTEEEFRAWCAQAPIGTMVPEGKFPVELLGGRSSDTHALVWELKTQWIVEREYQPACAGALWQQRRFESAVLDGTPPFYMWVKTEEKQGEMQPVPPRYPGIGHGRW